MEIKTAEEMFMAIQEEECPNVNNFILPEDWQIKVMIAYAEQFIDFGIEDLNNQSEYQAEAYLKHLKTLIK